MPNASLALARVVPNDRALSALRRRNTITPFLVFVAGVRGTVSRFVTTVLSPSTTYHFFEVEVSSLDADWPEAQERRREWVDFAEAVRRVAWKQELAQGLMLSSLAPPATTTARR